MLAWMHQAVASEEEFLQAVFGNSSESREQNSNEPGVGSSEQVIGGDISSSSGSGSAHVYSEENEKSSSSELAGLGIEELLARCLQGLGRPLRVRIMQVP